MRLAVPLLPIFASACFAPTTPGSNDGGTDGSTGSTGSATDDPSTTAMTATTGPTDPSTTEPTSTTASTTDPTEPTTVDSSSEDSDPTDTTGVGPGCGNDQADPGEGCDDGNTESGDGCSAACQDEAVFCEPRVIGTYDNIFEPLTLVTGAGDFVAVADAYGPGPAITTINISDPDEPTFQSAVNLGIDNYFADLIGRSDRILAVGDPLVTAISVADDGTVGLVDQIDGSGQFPFQAALQGTTLYIADDSTTRVVNTADLNNMFLTGGSLNVAGVMFPSYDGVATSGNGAFVSVGLLGVFDITVPATPVLHGTTALMGGGLLAASDDGLYVYNMTGSGISITDVSDTDDPAAAGSVAYADNAATRDLATRGSFVYVGASNGDIFAFDVSDPEAPVVAGEVDAGSDPAVSLHTGDAYLYIILGGTMHLVADLPGYCDSICGNGVTEYPELCDDGDLESGDDCDVDCSL